MESYPIPLVKKKAPEFKAMALVPGNKFEEVTLNSFKILGFDKIVPQLLQRGVTLLGCSVDSHYSHLAWVNTPLEKGGLGPLNHTLISDITKDISKKYGVLLEDEGIALRGMFLIDKSRNVRYSTICDLSVGRSTDEALRIIDAVQAADLNGDVCPLNWQKGQNTLKANKDEITKFLTNKYVV